MWLNKCGTSVGTVAPWRTRLRQFNAMAAAWRHDRYEVRFLRAVDHHQGVVRAA